MPDLTVVTLGGFYAQPVTVAAQVSLSVMTDDVVGHAHPEGVRP